ncbi:hypothetical protein VCHA37P200_110014 [Vibrio chagasii]|nr:hypothetical protein VCHA55O507_190025 [Vibrio chagasii]CAH7101913.1 hypothetical protein VCHA37P200_110014 [Vibrio chagasii]CAH7117118.1 hypothetical protein VCHA53O468_220016 [Vibrio chagasii]CAH7329361.1 hypothetical protein VCHA43P274_230016 [Vibrio chagasii]
MTRSSPSLKYGKITLAIGFNKFLPKFTNVIERLNTPMFAKGTLNQFIEKTGKSTIMLLIQFDMYIHLL